MGKCFWSMISKTKKKFACFIYIKKTIDILTWAPLSTWCGTLAAIETYHIQYTLSQNACHLWAIRDSNPFKNPTFRHDSHHSWCQKSLTPLLMSDTYRFTALPSSLNLMKLPWSILPPPLPIPVRASPPPSPLPLMSYPIRSRLLISNNGLSSLYPNFKAHFTLPATSRFLRTWSAQPTAPPSLITIFFAVDGTLPQKSYCQSSHGQIRPMWNSSHLQRQRSDFHDSTHWQRAPSVLRWDFWSALWTRIQDKLDCIDWQRAL